MFNESCVGWPARNGNKHYIMNERIIVGIFFRKWKKKKDLHSVPAQDCCQEFSLEICRFLQQQFQLHSLYQWTQSSALSFL